MKSIAILGSTGSIGRSTLELVRTHPKKFKVRAMAAGRNGAALAAQAREFKPEMVCLHDKAGAAELARELKPLGIRVTAGDEGLLEICRLGSVEQVIFAMVGAAGLPPVLEAIKARKQVAIANKEPLVVAGELILREARKYGAPVFPIDSEHSGLWQCLDGRPPQSVKKLVLTSSGGPFRGRKKSFTSIKPAEALRHPKWKMGPKITIDSATLMNKGLEVIEAANLFNVPAERIEVLVHPEAVIHAMVEFVDGTHLAQMAVTDMRVPIQYAMTYPDRLVNHLPTLDIAAIREFHFEKPDLRRFPCLELGYAASRAGGSMPAALNAANEIAVASFLAGEIPFMSIPKTIAKVMKRHRTLKNPSLSQLLETDRWARIEAKELL